MKKNNSLIFVLKIFIKNAPIKLIVDICFYSAKNILVTFNSVWLLRYVTLLLTEPTSSFKQILKVLLVFLLINTVFEIFSAIYTEMIFPRMEVAARGKIEGEIVERVKDLSQQCFEDEGFYTTIKQAQRCVSTTLFTVYSDVIQSLGWFAALINTVVIVIEIDPELLFFVLFVIPNFVVLKKGGKLNAEKNMEIAYSDKVKEYMQDSYLHKEYVRKYKTSEAAKITEKYYSAAFHNGKSIHKKYAIQLMCGTIFTNFFSLTFLQALSYGYGLFCLFHKENITIADFSVVFLAVTNMTSRVNKIARKYEHVSRLSGELVSLQKLDSLNKEIVKGGELIPERFEYLEFHNVSFSYGNRRVLTDVSFRIDAGQRISIAGHNGAGKSTLVKLIYRFYMPERGEILFNGIDIQKFDLIEYRNRLSAAFQDYKLFNLSLMDNISLNKGDESKVRSVLHAVGLEDLVDQLDVQVGRDFDTWGMEPSGGMRQRIVIARALYRKFDVLILDEPDAALDPISSQQILDGIINNTGNKTVIFISHHLSTAKQADKILMFRDGRLIEQGRHTVLMAQNGEYAAFFRYQSKQYKENTGGVE